MLDGGPAGNVGGRGRSGDPLYGIKRLVLTRRSMVTPTNAKKLAEVLTREEHLAVQVNWHYYQEIVAGYGEARARGGKLRLFKVIEALHVSNPNELKELRVLGQTLWKRRKDSLACFDVGTSNGPVEDINETLERLRGIALGFKNKSHYILSSLLRTGGLRKVISPL